MKTTIKTGFSAALTCIPLFVCAPLLALELQPILQNIVISKSQQHVQQTPLDYWDGTLYLAYIAPGAEGDVDGTSLHTMVSMGVPADSGSWEWTTNIIEERTIFDTWHTAPSIGVDKNGHVHIAYNMHNLPWQYKVSKNPEDISEFEFLGQDITVEEIRQLKEQNKTNFPGRGEASIPGNQITYPQFVRDLNSDLYVTYRFAAKPAREFNERTMSSGMAKFEADTKSWSAIGAPVSIAKRDYEVTEFPWFHSGPAKKPLAIAAQEGWTSYLPRLSFGPNNRTNLNLFWREGLAGEELSKPCFLTSTDFNLWTNAEGVKLSMPLTPDQCNNLGIDDESSFYSIGNSVADSAGNPYFILSPFDNTRQIYSFKNGQWQSQESPYGATNLFIDALDTVWAVANGLRVLRKKIDEDEWELLYENKENTECNPRTVLNDKKTKAYIYSTTCDSNELNIYSIDLFSVTSR